MNEPLVINGRKIHTMDDVRRANRDAGQNWFSPDTLHWFGSRIGNELYGYRFFVTSEYTTHRRESRAYSVREVMPDGSIRTVGEFGQYPTRGRAITAARRLARGE